MSSVLSEEDATINIIDINNNPSSPIKRVKNAIKKADLVGISIKSFTLHESLNIVKSVEKIIKNKTVVCGGPHITLDGMNFLKQNKIFKIGVLGEGESTIKDVTNGMRLSKIKGIVYREGNKVKASRPRKSIINLDKLPFPEYEHFDSFTGKIIDYPLITSRGCPYSCIYCSVGKIVGKKWRARSPKNVIEELLHAKDKYQIKRFSILDDNFTLDMNRAKKICQLLIDAKANLKWSCPNGIRADRLDNELIELMKDAGCYQVSIGVESADKKVFDNIKKGETLTDVENAIKLCKKVGLEVVGFFIVGLPLSNIETVKKSIKFANKFRVRAEWNMFSPYPMTEAWDWVTSNARILRHWTEGFHFGSNVDTIFETDRFSRKERLDIYYFACLKTGSYEQFYDKNKDTFSNTLTILKIIWNYDKGNLHKHLVELIKRYVKYTASGKMTKKV